LYHIIILPFSISQKAPTSIAHWRNGPLHSTAAAMRTPPMDNAATTPAITTPALIAALKPNIFYPLERCPERSLSASHVRKPL
jgi:hypothetical protein